MQLVIAEGALAPVLAEFEQQPVTVIDFTHEGVLVETVREGFVFVVSSERLIVEVVR